MDSDDVKKQLAEYRQTHQGAATESLLSAIEELAERIDRLQKRLTPFDRMGDVPARPVRYQQARGVVR